ncbi:MAG: MBL fold metallo-hydrolase [Bacteroidetes bacterium]|nr:MBL fold metallo-hydrolase [Bacteroidota bacterium]
MQLTIGPYTITPLETGRFALDGGAMFGVVPKNLWSRTNPPDEQNRIPMAMRSLLVQGNGKNILIDTGMGQKYDEKNRSIYKYDNETGTLESSLATMGLTPADITDVIQTHCHFDHCGGAVTQTADGKLVPTFANAKYYVQKEHLAWARKPTEKDRASFMKNDYEPLVAEGMLTELDGPGEIFPGIELHIFNGHTKAQQLPLITDGTTKLFFCADLVPTKAHINFPYIMGYDNWPLTTLEEKKKYVPRMHEEQWLLLLEHDPSDAIVRVEATEKGFKAVAISE